MLKYIYFGTPEISKKVLLGLMDIYGEPKCIVTIKDKKSGRKMLLTESPLKQLAISKNIPFLTPEKLRDVQNEIKSYNSDVGILLAYGKIIPEWLLEAFPMGIINVHPSLLPFYRGSSPLTGPILNGEDKTGITIMDMDKELDHGDIYLTKELFLKQDTNRLDIEDFVVMESPTLLKIVLENLENKTQTKTPQDHTLATYTQKIQKEDGEILANDNDDIKYRKYKAFLGWPGIYFFDKNNKRIKITKAIFKDDKFVIEKVIPENSKEISYEEYLSQR